MDTEVPGAASAGTPQTETVSAERVAADAGDFSSFQHASRDRRVGKAPADVVRPKAAKPAAAAAATPDAAGAAGRQPAAVVTGKDGLPAKGPKPADSDADARLTTRIREAVDTATAESTRRIRELEEQVASARRPAAAAGEQPGGAGAAASPTARKALTKTEIAAYQALPGAPKLTDVNDKGEYLYDTSGEHAVALAEFIREQRTAEAETTNRSRTEYVERVKREAARVTTFSERIEAFKRENETILVDNGKGGKAVPLSPEVSALHGFAQLHTNNQQRQAQGLQPLPATVDHAIAEELYDSEIPMQVGRYLTEHPEELAQLRTATAPAQLTRMFGGLEARVRATSPVKAAPADGAKPKTPPAADVRREAEQAVDRSVSSVQPLDGTLGRGGAGSGANPEEQAVLKGDFASYQETQRQRRLEQLEARGRTGARR